MEAVLQAKALCEIAQRGRSPLPVAHTGPHTSDPTVRIPAPPFGPNPLERLHAVLQNPPHTVALRRIEQSERMERHQVGEMAVRFRIRQPLCEIKAALIVHIIAEAFVESIHLLYPEPEPLPIVVFSAVADKDYEWMIAYLCRYLPAKLYIVTEIPDKRRVSAEELKKVFERYTDCEVVAKSDIGDALKEAYDRRGESEIYCLGSLYLVGAIKERIAGGNNHAELR